MKALLLAVLTAVGLSGCYAEGAPYGAYETGYYAQPSYGYGYGYTTGGPVYGNTYVNRGYRPGPVYRPASGVCLGARPGLSRRSRLPLRPGLSRWLRSARLPPLVRRAWGRPVPLRVDPIGTLR